MDDFDIPEIEVKPAQGPRRLRFAPIEHGNTSFDHLILREPTVADLITMRKKVDPIEQITALIQSVTGLPGFVMARLPQGVIEAAGDYFEGFSKPTPPVGKA